MAVSGHFEELKRFADELGELSHVVADTARIAAPKLQDMVQGEFASGIDPYGTRWRPLVTGEASYLTKTGALKGSLSVFPQTSSIVVRFGSSYAGYHQSGTKHMSRRQIVPDRGDIPPKWVTILELAVGEATWAIFQRRAA